MALSADCFNYLHVWRVMGNSTCWAGTPKNGVISPWPFKRRAKGSEVLFHNSIMGDSTVYQNRLETNLLQLFAHPENSEWLLHHYVLSTFLPNKNKHNWWRLFVFYKFPLPSTLLLPLPLPLIRRPWAWVLNRQNDFNNNFQYKGVILKFLSRQGCAAPSPLRITWLSMSYTINLDERQASTTVKNATSDIVFGFGSSAMLWTSIKVKTYKLWCASSRCESQTNPTRNGEGEEQCFRFDHFSATQAKPVILSAGCWIF